MDRHEVKALGGNLPAIDKFNSKLQTDRFEAQCVVAVAALASRLTNVAVIDASCGPHGYKTWKELGVNIDEHGIGHTHPDSPERDKNAVPIRQFHATRVADLAKRLAAIPEGNGTMLDSTLIIWMSDSAEEHHGQGMQWPLVLVGNLGGKLKTAGRYLQFTEAAMPKPTPAVISVFASLARLPPWHPAKPPRRSIARVRPEPTRRPSWPLNGSGRSISESICRRRPSRSTRRER